jgi:hypothetical protein
VSDAVVTILAACTTVDNHSAVSPAYLPPRNATSPGGDALAALKAVGTYWNYDTSQMCFEGPMRVLLVMGIMWVVAFCAGFPLVMVLVLWMNRERLGEVKVREWEGQRAADAAASGEWGPCTAMGVQ